jgi:hypothetical protein
MRLSPRLLLLLLTPRASSAIVLCGTAGNPARNFTCPDGNTCCPLRGLGSSSPGDTHRADIVGAAGWGCCVDEEPGQGVCCADGRSCCAHGYTCDGPGGCVADRPKEHPLAQRTNLCARYLGWNVSAALVGL